MGLRQLRYTALILTMLIVVGKAMAQCVAPTITYPDTLCNNAPLIGEGLESGYPSVRWLFGMQEVTAIPSPVSLGTLSGSVSNVTYGMSIVYENGNYYGFVKDYNARDVSRLNFGNSLSNTPTVTPLTVNAFPNETTISDGDIALLKRNGLWYGFTGCRGGNSIVRYQFGSSITNDTVTATNIGNLGNQLNLPYSVDIDTLNDSIYLSVASWTGNRFTIYNLGVNPTNTTPVWHKTVNLGSGSPSINQMSGIETHYTCDKKVVFVCGYGSNNVVRCDFGNSFENTPINDQISGGSRPNANSINLRYDRGYPELFVKSRTNTNNIFYYQFPDSIDQATVQETVLTDQSATMMGLSLQVQYAHDGMYTFSINNSGTAYRVHFPYDSVGSTNASTAPEADLALGAEGYLPFSVVSVDAAGNLFYHRDSVYLLSAPSIAAFSAQNLCFGDATSLNGTAGYADEFTEYTWLINGVYDASDSLSTIRIFNDTGLQHIQLIGSSIANECVDSVDTMIHILDLPTASFTIDTTCQGAIAELANSTSLYYLDTSATFLWETPNAIFSGALPEIIFQDSGTFALQLFVSTSNGCMDSLSQDVFIKPSPVANFGVESTCIGDSTAFQNNSGSTTSYTSFWQFGDGNTSNQFEPSYAYGDTGFYTVQLKTEAQNGCSDSTEVEVVVTTVPTPSFMINVPVLCSETPLTFNDASSADHAIHTRILTFGTDTIFNPSGTIAIPSYGQLNGNYKVIAGTDCRADSSFSAYVNARPTIQYSKSAPCLGSLVVFESNAGVADNQEITSYHWDFSDGENYTDTTVERSFLSQGNYVVDLLVTTDSNCTASVQDSFYVAKAPKISFDLEGPYCDSVEIPYTVKLITDPFDPEVDLSWYAINDTDDTLSFTDSILQLNLAGTYQIVLEAMSAIGCRDTFDDWIQVANRPKTRILNDTFCIGNVARFEANIQGSNFEYLWQYGDGQTSVASSIQYFASDTGQFPVFLQILDKSSGCAASDTAQTLVLREPLLSLEEKLLCLGDLNSVSVAIDAHPSDAIEGFRWFMNDVLAGIDSVLSTDLHDEAVAIRVEIETRSGCVNSTQRNYGIHAPLDPHFDLLGAFGTVPVQLYGTPVESNYTHTWTIDGDTIGTTGELDYLVAQPTNKALLHTIQDTNGCRYSAAFPLTIYSGTADLALVSIELKDSVDHPLYLTIENTGGVPLQGFAIDYSVLKGSATRVEYETSLAVGQRKVVRTSNLIWQASDIEYYCATVAELFSLEDINSGNDRVCGSLNDADFLPYPNPSSGSLRVPFVLTDDFICTYQVFDALGNLMWEKSEAQTEGYHELLLTDLPLRNGAYVLRIISDEVKEYSFLIVQ